MISIVFVADMRLKWHRIQQEVNMRFLFIRAGWLNERYIYSWFVDVKR